MTAIKVRRSAPSTGLLLFEQMVHHPATSNMIAPLATVVEDIGAGASCFFERVCKNCKSGEIKSPCW